jgi:hypothetical protein
MKHRTCQRHDAEDDDQAIWEMNAAPGAPFSPLDSGKVSGWLRLAASQQSGGEWTPSIVDVLNPGSPMVQTGVNRRAAVGVSANGLPTMLFDGTDIHLWPQAPALSSTTKVGLWFWYKPATVAGVQRLWACVNGQLGCSTERLQFYANGSTLRCEAYITNANGRTFDTSAATLTAGAWHAIYLQYDSSRGGDANLAIFVGGVSKALTPTNIGAGGTLTVLQAATGSASVGGVVDSDTPVQPIVNGGEIGPNIIPFNDNLTAPEIANMMLFEVPT